MAPIKRAQILFDRAAGALLFCLYANEFCEVIRVSFLRPQTLEEALAALSDGAVAIAGGTDVYPAMGVPPDAMVDLTALAELRGITQDDGGWRIGAATTWSEIAHANLPPAFDGLRAAAREVGALQIQNVGTIGGNLCNASPAADGVPALLTLGALVDLVGPGGVRVLPLSDFITGVRQTALRPGEVLRSLRVSDPGAARAAFVKLGARRYQVISIAMVAVLLRCTGGRIEDVRLVVGSCSPVAQRLPSLEASLIGVSLEAAEQIIRVDPLRPLSPIDDVRGSGIYRREAVADLLWRAVREAADG